MNADALRTIIDRHAAWRYGYKSGVRADLNGADLTGVDLRDADLRRANLACVFLRGADLSDAVLRSADLSGANLAGANICGADLRYANLRFANLTGADLSGADLRFSKLIDAHLRFANLAGAELYRADLSGAYLRGTGVVVIGGGPYQGCVTPTHVHVGCVRIAIECLPEDDDTEYQDNIHPEMPEWWRRYGGVVRAAIVASQADLREREEVSDD